MGLLTGLLTAPLAPVRGMVWVAERLCDEAERVQAEQLRRQLEELEAALLAGELSEAEFESAEEALLDDLSRYAGRGAPR